MITETIDETVLVEAIGAGEAEVVNFGNKIELSARSADQFCSGNNPC